MNEKSIYRVFAVVPALLAVVHGFLAIALYSNWFRYGLDLEGTVALLFLIPIDGAIILGSFFYFISLERARIRKARIFGLVLLSLTLISLFYMYKSLPEFYLDQIWFTETSRFDANGTSFEYKLEIKNQWANSQETVLHVVDVKSGSTTKVNLPVNSSEFAVTYDSPAIGNTMKPIQDSIYEFKFYSLDTYVFRVDLENKTAELTAQRPTKTQRCTDGETGMHYTCPIESLTPER